MVGSLAQEIMSKVSFPSPRECTKLLLPILVISFIFWFHTALPNVYPEGYTAKYYPIMLEVSLLIYLVFAVLSCWFEPIRKKVLHYCWLIIAAFVLLEVMDYTTLKTGLYPLPYIPSPNAILASFFENVKGVSHNFTQSLFLLLEGVLVGMIMGVIYGSLMGINRFCNYWFDSFIKIVGPVPTSVWVVIAMVLAPSNHVASVCLIALVVWYPLSVQLGSAMRGIERVYLEKAEIMGASKAYSFFHVTVPNAIPAFFNGMFMGLCNSFTALYTAEMLGVKGGLGWYLHYAEQWNEFDKIFMTIVLFILMTFICITILFKIQNHVMKWQKGLVQW